MPEIKTEFLFTIALEVEVSDLGDTPYGGRRIARFGTGSFEGPKLRGTVLPGGAGWMLMRRDGVLEIEVRLTLETDRGKQTREVRAGESYLSSSDPRVHFGLGASTSIRSLEVRWPSGVVQKVEGVQPGRYQKIVEPSPAR